MQARSVRFAETARLLGDAARAQGLVAPGFRSPPRRPGVDRLLRRGQSEALVSVRLRDRPWPAVVADMIEGVVVANDLDPPAASRCRTALWAALEQLAASDGADPFRAAASAAAPDPSSPSPVEHAA